MTDSSLCLIDGLDTPLQRGIRLLAALGLLSLLTVSAAVTIKVLGCCVLAALWLRFETRRKQHVGQAVSLDRNGQITSNGKKYGCGTVDWAGRWYTVLCCNNGSRCKRLLISSTRQNSDEYRKLLAWIRLGRLSGSETTT